jgi:chaperone required for assembly of F1-ATPase
MKRNYTVAQAISHPGGYAVHLDALPVQTPLGRELVVPSQALAESIAQEWNAQGEQVERVHLRLTQIASIALDLAPQRRDALIEELTGYAGTDLICYRAGNIPELRTKQAELLDPVMQWAEIAFGLHFNITEGILPIAQPAENESKLKIVLAGWDGWKLAALAAAAKPLGSVLLALALTERHLDAQTAFDFAHLEESFESDAWGPDEEKDAKLLSLKLDTLAAGLFVSLV